MLKTQLNARVSVLSTAIAVKLACAHHWLKLQLAALVVAIQHSAAALQVARA